MPIDATEGAAPVAGGAACGSVCVCCLVHILPPIFDPEQLVRLRVGGAAWILVGPGNRSNQENVLGCEDQTLSVWTGQALRSFKRSLELDCTGRRGISRRSSRPAAQPVRRSERRARRTWEWGSSEDWRPPYRAARAKWARARRGGRWGVAGESAAPRRGHSKDPRRWGQRPWGTR